MIKILMTSMLASLLSLGAAVAYAAPAPTETTAVATCNDGKTMYGNNARHGGACRGHGGVKAWADGSPVKRKGATRTYR